MQPRRAIRRHAERMEAKLRIHDETRDCWRKETLHFLLGWLQAEVIELMKAVADGDAEKIAYEAADVSNLAMFIADASDKEICETRGR